MLDRDKYARDAIRRYDEARDKYRDRYAREHFGTCAALFAEITDALTMYHQMCYTSTDETLPFIDARDFPRAAAGALAVRLHRQGRFPKIKTALSAMHSRLVAQNNVRELDFALDKPDEYPEPANRDL